MMIMKFKTKTCPDIWRQAKTILLQKPVANEGGRGNSNNGKPIALIYILF
jgi:hypothetical protein